MENQNEQIKEQVDFDTKLTQASVTYLKGAMPWMKFLSILGFIASGFMLIFALAMFFGGGAMLGNLGRGVGISYLIGAVVVFFLNKYLFDYANGIGKYINTNDPAVLELAFKMQKNFWKFKGILFIIYLSFVILALIFFVIGGASSPSLF
ncbi:MAG: DUF5362 family protein [Bacteroidales bacterium]